MKKYTGIVLISFVSLNATAPQNAADEEAQLAAARAASQIMAEEEAQLAQILKESERTARVEEEKRRLQKAASAAAFGATKDDQIEVLFRQQINKCGVKHCVDRLFFGFLRTNLHGGVGIWPTKLFERHADEMHKTGHLWPNKYMQVFFQCGLLNYFLDQNFNVVAPGGLINDIPIRELGIL